MRYYCLIMGIVSLVYYLVLVFYSRRLKSTFAAFWLVNGGVHLGLGCAPFPVYAYRILGVFCLIGWSVFLSAEIKIIRCMFQREDGNAEWIIVLGAQVRGTDITDSLKKRLDRALAYAEQFPDVKLIVSGGKGPGEDISEAEAMAGYLIRRGICRERICLENQSASTRENLRFSRKYLDAENARIGIVTNNFHICRSLMIARQEGYRNVSGLPAKSSPVFQLNYLVREFFGVLYVWAAGQRRGRQNSV